MLINILSIVSGIATIFLALFPLIIRSRSLRQRFLDQIVEIDPPILVDDQEKERIIGEYMSNKSPIIQIDRVDRLIFSISVFNTQKYILYTILFGAFILQLIIFLLILGSILPDFFLGYEKIELAMFGAVILCLPFGLVAMRMAVDVDLLAMGFEVSLGDKEISYFSAYNQFLSIEKHLDLEKFSRQKILPSDRIRLVVMRDKSRFRLLERNYIAITDNQRSWRVFEFLPWMGWVSNIREVVAVLPNINKFIERRYRR